MSGWPGDTSKPEAETEIKPPKADPGREALRQEALRRLGAARPSEDASGLLVMAVLEVAASVDRLTAELRDRR